MNQNNDTTKGIARWLIRTVIFALIQAAALFLGAGTANWPMAWVYIGVFILVQIITMLILLATSPDLLIERTAVQEGTKNWDQLLARLTALFGPLLIWIVCGLDRRFSWSPPVSSTIQWIGLAVILSGSLLTAWAMAANRFFSGTVRIQQDRGHTVSTGGPYRYIRHPGYLGALLYDLASPLTLGAWWAYLPAILTTLIVILRTSLEDRTLKQELPGYNDYARNVRYRLLPGIW
jgi:protein-S-isoprenylcysteine O-methyltransferase Ste14